MATQFSDITPRSFPMFAVPKPTVRIAYIAGPAVTAVGRALAALPPEARELLIDDLTARDAIVAEILDAAADLSLVTRRAFLAWLAVSIEYETDDTDTGEEAMFLECDVAHHVLARSPAETEADLWLKVYLRELGELPDSSLIGPLTYELSATEGMLVERRLSQGIIEALPRTFRLARPLGALSAMVSARDGSAAPLLAEAAAAMDPLSLYGWSCALMRMQMAQGEVDQCPREREKHFSEACSALANAQIALLKTPAPTLVELAYKQKLFFQINAHEFDQPGIGASISADVDRLIRHSGEDYDASWERGVADLEATREAFSVLMPTDEVTDAVADRELQVGTAILAPSADTIAHAVAKLRTIIELYDHKRDENLVSVLADFERLSARAAAQENPALVLAFEQFRSAFREMKDDVDGSMSKADEDLLLSRMDPADDVLYVTPAITPAGVAMRLKRAFVGIVGEHWSDFAVFDARPPAFAEGLRVEGMYAQMVWRSIEDLERMDGVRQEQGA